MNLRAVDTEGDQDARHFPEPDPRPREPFTASSSTFQRERKKPREGGKSPIKCQRKALNLLTSSLLTGLLPGSCLKVLTERERSKGQQAMKQQLFFSKHLLCAKPCTS